MAKIFDKLDGTHMRKRKRPITSTFEEHPVGPYTEQQKKLFQDEFSRKRRQHFLVLVLLASTGILLVVVGSLELPSVLWWTALGNALIIVAGSLAFERINWRCPACGISLGGAIGQTHCRKCGVELR